MTSTRLRDAAAVVTLLVAALLIGIPATRVAYDDAWVTFRYAYNLASGNGFVYNLGERYLGTSAPFYAVVLAAGGWFSPDAIPAISGVLGAVSLAALALGLYAYGRTFDDWLGGLLAGLFFVVSPIAMESFGGEMLPQTALIVWAFVAEARRKWMLAVALAIVATLVRPDGVLALGLIGLHQVWTRRALPWREIAVSTLVLGVWYGALWIYFGAPLPQTLAAKHAQRLSGFWRPLGFDMVDWFRSLTIYPSLFFPSRPAAGFTSFLALSALGVVALLWQRHWWGLLVWPVAFMIVYRQLHVPFYHWYAIPPLVALAVSAAAACAAAAAALVWTIEKLRPGGTALGPERRWLAQLPILLLVTVSILWSLGRLSARGAAAHPGAVEIGYEQLGRWLASNTPPDATVGYMEIGIMGFYSRRTIIDALGLVNPDVAQHIAQRDLTWAFRTHRPDYIVALDSVPPEPWFEAEYQYVTSLESGRASRLRIFRRTR